MSETVFNTSRGSSLDKQMAFIVLLITTLFYSWNGYVSEGFNGGADSITHFQIAKYSWKYHWLLMDQWGKPVFTLVASVFAQYGFKAVVFFNIALIIWGVWLSWAIAKRMNLRNAWMVPFLVAFAPIVMGNGVSGLTEMICALFLIGFMYLFLRHQIVLASLLVSFMPFARSEGFVVLAVLFLFFVFTKRWKYIPLLAFGSVVYNIAGYLQTGQALWIFAQNPYLTSEHNAYGSGPWYHFLMFGIPMFGIAFLLSIFTTVKEAKWLPGLLTFKNTNPQQAFVVWVCMGTAWGYFAAHTFLWWQGMWASLGLLRVMFVIVVPMSILAVIGWNTIYEKIQNKQWITYRAIAIFLGLTIVGPFLVDEYPVPLGVEEQVHNSFMADYKLHEEWQGRKIYAANPYLHLMLEMDPYDVNVYEPLWGAREAKPGDLILWDAHFGPNEHMIPLEELSMDSSFVEIDRWRPETTFYTLNGYEFELVLMEKK